MTNYRVDGKQVSDLTEEQADLLGRFNHDVETITTFEKSVRNDSDGYGVDLSLSALQDLILELVDEDGAEFGSIYLDPETVPALRDALNEYLGEQPHPAGHPVSDRSLTVAVEAMLTAGKKIAAIKLYREVRGGGLREAKAAVEQIGEAVKPFNNRVLRDADGDWWFEVKTDVFRMGYDRADAESKHRADPTWGKPLDHLQEAYGPLTDVTDTVG